MACVGLTWFVILAALTVCSRGKSTTFANVTVNVLAGSNVTMRSSRESCNQSHWRIESHNKTITLPHSDYSRHTVMQHSTYCELRIVSMQLSDAGTYQQLDRLTLAAYRAQLIVIDTEPSCSTKPATLRSLVTGDVIVFTCRVIFFEWWTQTVVWQHLDNFDKHLSDTQVTRDFLAAQEREHRREKEFILKETVSTDSNNTKYRLKVLLDVDTKPLANVSESTILVISTSNFNQTWTSETVRAVGVTGHDISTKLFILIAVTCASIVLLALNVIFVANYRSKQRRAVNTMSATLTIPDVAQSGNLFNHSTTDNGMTDGLHEDGVSSPQETMDGQTVIDADTDIAVYAEMMSSGRRRSFSSINIAGNNAVYAHIDHTVQVQPRQQNNQRSMRGNRR